MFSYYFERNQMYWNSIGASGSAENYENQGFSLFGKWTPPSTDAKSNRHMYKPCGINCLTSGGHWEIIGNNSGIF